MVVGLAERVVLPCVVLSVVGVEVQGVGAPVVWLGLEEEPEGEDVVPLPLRPQRLSWSGVRERGAL